jgi:hypothetical protein
MRPVPVVTPGTVTRATTTTTTTTIAAGNAPATSGSGALALTASRDSRANTLHQTHSSGNTATWLTE